MGKLALKRKRARFSGAAEEIVYDEDARREYLTVFRKRKAERRVEALEKAREKEQAALKALRSLKRKEASDFANGHGANGSSLPRAWVKAGPDAAAENDDNNEEGGGGNEEEIDEPGIERERTEYVDDFTRDAFGGEGAVVVTTALGWPGEEEEEEEEEEDEEDNDNDDNGSINASTTGSKRFKSSGSSYISRSAREELELERLRELALPHKERIAAKAAIAEAKKATQMRKALLEGKKKKLKHRRGKDGKALPEKERRSGKSGKSERRKRSKNSFPKD